MANQYTNPWTSKEDDVLYDNIGNLSYNSIARKLNRNVYSVKRRSERLGIHKHILTGAISAKELADIVGVDPTTVIRYWIPSGLKGKQKNFVWGGTTKHKPYFIYPEDFWKWAENNKHRINFSRIERGVLIPEPDWFKEEWDKDFYVPNKTKAKWTKEEDDSLWKMYYEMGMKQKDIATQMNRTKHGVEKRLRRLREKKMQST